MYCHRLVLLVHYKGIMYCHRLVLLVYCKHLFSSVEDMYYVL